MGGAEKSKKEACLKQARFRSDRANMASAAASDPRGRLGKGSLTRNQRAETQTGRPRRRCESKKKDGFVSEGKVIPLRQRLTSEESSIGWTSSKGTLGGSPGICLTTIDHFS